MQSLAVRMAALAIGILGSVHASAHAATERTVSLQPAHPTEVTIYFGDAARRAAQAVCIPKWQGPNAGYLTTWYTGNERYAVYQNPIEVACATPYPFGITKIVWRVTNQTASVLTIFMQPTVYSIAVDSDSCPKPGTTLYAGPVYQVDLPALSSANVALSLQDTICVNGPYFAGVECPNMIGLGKLGINLDSAQVVPRRTCASYNDFQSSWDEVITEYNFPGNLLLWSEGVTGPTNGCTTGGNCCAGLRGNVDCSANGTVDISDLTTMVDHLFLSNTPLCCVQEANVEVNATVDIADLTFLVDYLFISNPPMSSCP